MILTGWPPASSTVTSAADGIGITTRDGDEIGAWYSRLAELQGIQAEIAAVVAEIDQRMEACREELLLSQYSLAADIFRGYVSAPLATANGVNIGTNSGVSIAAIKNL